MNEWHYSVQLCKAATLRVRWCIKNVSSECKWLQQGADRISLSFRATEGVQLGDLMYVCVLNWVTRSNSNPGLKIITLSLSSSGLSEGKQKGLTQLASHIYSIQQHSTIIWWSDLSGYRFGDRSIKNDGTGCPVSRDQFMKFVNPLVNFTSGSVTHVPGRSALQQLQFFPPIPLSSVPGQATNDAVSELLWELVIH